MALVLSSAASQSRRLGFRRKMVDWRVVGLTAASAVIFRPAIMRRIVWPLARPGVA